MGARTPRAVTRKAKAVASAGRTAAVRVRVAGLVDGFLAVAPEEEPPAKEKVVRRLRQLHPMD